MGLVIIGLVLFFVFRWNSLSASAWVNSGSVAFTKYPAWRAVVDDDQLNGSTQLTSYLQRVIEHSEGNVSLMRARGLLLFLQGSDDEAVAVWQTTGLDPAQVVAFQGNYAQSVNQNKVALAWYEHAVVLDPNLASAWHTLGEVRQQAGQIDGAKAAFERAYSLGYANSVNPLAKLWRDEGNHEAAVSIWQSALDTFPEDPDRLHWWQGLTNSLRATEQWGTGLAFAEMALHEFPDDARLYVEIGAIVYGRNADSIAAMNMIKKAIELDDTIVSAYSTAAGIMAAEKQYEAAYDWYTEAINRAPQNPSWYVARGHMARAAGDLPLALDAFQSAIDRFPAFSPAYLGIATVYQLLEDKDNAVTAITRALQVADNKNVQDYLRAGEIYEWSGDLEEAVVAYQQALVIDPDNKPVNLALQRLQNK